MNDVGLFTALLNGISFSIAKKHASVDAIQWARTDFDVFQDEDPR